MPRENRAVGNRAVGNRPMLAHWALATGNARKTHQKTPVEREETAHEPFSTKKPDTKKIIFDLVFFSIFHVRDRGLDRGALQDGFVFEKNLI